MSIQEQRKSERSKAFLIVNFRNHKDLHGYSLGITNDISQKGVCFESSNFDHRPGEKLELVLRHPHKAMSVSTEGEIVWKKEGWYECALGVRLKARDIKTETGISEVIANMKDSTVRQPVAYSIPAQSTEQQKGATSSDKPKNSALIVLSSEAPLYSETKRNNVIPISAGKRMRKPEAPNKIPVNSAARLEFVQGVRAKPRNKRPEKKTILFILLISILSVAAYTFTMNRAATKGTGEEPFAPAAISGIGRAAPAPVITTEKMTVPESSSGAEKTTESEKITVPEKAAPAPDIRVPEKITAPEPVAPVADLKRVINFDFRSDEVSAAHFAKIDDVVNEANNRPESIVKVEGHADSIGAPVYNLDISMRRALAVKKLLLEKGVESRKIQLALFGDSKPVASNSSESGRMSNRRVELVVMSPDN
ncbi:MAG: OmpA family protein [Nitrospiraceae bacterium]|nr:MAG: OmpA family protein [Nitrospiraceae bacterium]